MKWLVHKASLSSFLFNLNIHHLRTKLFLQLINKIYLLIARIDKFISCISAKSKNIIFKSICIKSQLKSPVQNPTQSKSLPVKIPPAKISPNPYRNRNPNRNPKLTGVTLEAYWRH